MPGNEAEIFKQSIWLSRLKKGKTQLYIHAGLYVYIYFFCSESWSWAKCFGL